LRRDYAGDDELDQPLQLLSGQVMRMQTVLTRLGDSVRTRGVSQTQAGPPMTLQAWLARTLEHWGLMWPQVRVRLEVADDLPMLSDDAALEAVLMVLLNNAAQALPDVVLLRASCSRQVLQLEVVDNGSGLEVGPGSSKANGWGVGLDLARAALERMDGRLEIEPVATGGVIARVILPLPEAHD
jgi:two-component system sensor histidine kinase RegB